MSKSLSRIRNLVSEIEEIHRNGQQGRRSMAADAGAQPSVAPPLTEVPPLPQPPAEATFAPTPQAAVAPSPEMQSEAGPEAKVLNMHDYRKDGQVYLRLKGSVALNLQMEDSGESIQVKQLGDILEIRFEDGKAFHLPLKAVA